MKVPLAFRLASLIVAVFLMNGTSHAQSCFNAAAPTTTPTTTNFPANDPTKNATTVQVNFQSDCTWHPATNSGFIHIVSSTNLGNGFIQYFVDANQNLAPRGSPSAIAIFSNSTNTGVSGVTQDAASGDFSFRVSPTGANVVPGSSTNFSLAVNRTGGFTGCVGFRQRVPTANVTVSFSNVTCSSATATVTVGSSLNNQEVDVFFAAQNGNVERDGGASIIVARPDFAPAPSPSFQTIERGAQASYNLSINPTVTFQGQPVTWSAPNPAGAVISFNPQGTASTSTMTVATDGTVALGPSNISITGTGVINGQTASRSTAVSLNVNRPPTALQFFPVSPCRVADTRNPVGPFGGPFLAARVSRLFAIPNSSCGIPSNASAYSLNATVVPHGLLGYLTLYACDSNLPVASTLNSIDGRVKAVAAIVEADSTGSVCAVPRDDTDLILDINGYFAPAAAGVAGMAFYPLAPCRVTDTRNAAGPLGGPSLASGVPRTIPVRSAACGVPAQAAAYSLNYTAVPQGALGFVTTWPAGHPQPLVSTLNAPTGAVTANAAIVPAGTNGDVSVFATDNTDLVIDINGYFAPPGLGGLTLHTVSPCRVLDTRFPPFGGTPFTGQFDASIDGNVCGVPSSAQAYVLSATVVPPGTVGFLALWPQGTAQPLTSTLNAIDGVVTSNLAIVGTQNGSISAFSPNPTNLVLDIVGYLAP